MERLSIDYTVSLELAEWLMTGGLARLTGLSLGHARQRYSQHSSVARLTPSRWASLLARCHLPHLQTIEIPVLFQPEDTDPGSQVRYRQMSCVRITYVFVYLGQHSGLGRCAEYFQGVAQTRHSHAS